MASTSEMSSAADAGSVTGGLADDGSPERDVAINGFVSLLADKYLSSDIGLHGNTMDTADWSPDSTDSAASLVDIEHPAMMSSLTPGGTTSLAQTLPNGRDAGSSHASSRGSSPSPDNTLGANRKTAGTSSELRSFVIEKELFESKLRKLQVENSSLQAENKQIKEKFNRTQARCQYLEAQLRTSQDDVTTLRDHFQEEVTSLKRRSRDRSDRDQSDLQDQVVRLTRDVELVRAENALLERQVEAASMNAKNTQSMPDWSKFMESYKSDISTLKEELDKSHSLLQQSEKDRKQEADSRKEATIQIIKLTELKALLQQQLENAGSGSVAEKQVLSIERRLKITEERLHQERADRAGKLSEVEEKLINENAKLQVSSKEMTRQLHRERDKNRSLTDKYNNARDEVDRLQVVLMDRPTILDNTPYLAKMATIRSTLGSKKHGEEVRHILEQVDKEHSLGAGQEVDIIWLLWHQREELNKQLREWDVALGNLNLRASDVTEALEILQTDRRTTDTQLEHSKEVLEDVQREKQELLSTFQHKVETLTRDKHSAIVKAKDLEDLNASITAENDSLKNSLRMSSGSGGTPRGGNTYNMEAQVEGLRSDLRTVQGDLHQSVRSQQVAENQVHSLRTQLATKEQALTQALGSLDQLEGAQRARATDNTQQHRIDRLSAEVRGLETEVRSWREKYDKLKAELESAEDENERLRKKSLQLRSTVDGGQTSGQGCDVAGLEADLQDKDDEIYGLTVRCGEADHELQRARQRLRVEEQHSEGLVGQMEQLQTQLRQKSRLMEQMSSAEMDYQVELQAVRDNLAMVNRELAQRSQELKLMSVDLSREQTKVHKLTQDISDREQLLSRDIASLVHQGAITSSLYQDSVVASPGATLAKAEMKVRMADYEKSSLKQEVQTANDSIQALVRENTDLSSRLLGLGQDLIKEQTHVTHVIANRSQLEQKYHVLVEERDAAVHQRALLEQQLVRHETQTHSVIERLEQEALQASTEHQQRYYALDSEGKQMSVELGTAKRLLEAREREIDVLRDAVFRQKEEVNALHRRVAVLTEENVVCHQNADKLSQQLSLKMKDHELTMETQQVYSMERTKLQMDKYQLENDLGKSRGELDRHATEVSEYKRKLEGAESLLHDLELKWQEKETKVAGLETTVQQMTRERQSVVTEIAEAKALAEALNREIYALHDPASDSLNDSIFEERASNNHLRDELTQALHQVKLIREEYSSYTTTLQSERRAVDTLKEKYQSEEDRAMRLDDRLRMQEAEIETLRGHLADTKGTMESYKTDKQSLYKDVQELFRQISEKDELVTTLQAKCAHTAETAQRDRLSEKEYSEQKHSLAQDNLTKLRKELDEAKESLRQKEVQLEVYHRTSRDLQHETRAKGDLEQQMTLVQSELSQATFKITTLDTENARLKETIRNTQENLEKSQQMVENLKEQAKEQREELTREVRELRTTVTDQSHRSSGEIRELQDRYNKTLADLRASEASLVAYTETKQSLYDSNKQLDDTIDSLKVKLHEEVTTRKLTEQRLETLQADHTQAKAKISASTEKIAELQNQLSKSDSDVTIEREKYRKLKRDLMETRSSNTTQEQHVQSLQMQVTELQAEISKLQNQLSSSEQNLGNKNKRLTLDLKQKVEDHDQERTKLLQQSQQLSDDLERAREQLATKSRDHLHLQEENLTLEEKAREANRQARQAADTLREQTTARDSLQNRNMELELLLAKLQKGSDDISFEATRAEVTRMLGELSQRMQLQLEQQRGSESEARARDLKKIEELKNKVAALEAGISQEQSMHIVTKTQVASLEEDNMRLRQQLQMVRKRTPHSGETERTKSRLEEINEIIARSQTRAEQLIATGAYADDRTRSHSPHRHSSPARDYGSPSSPAQQRYSPGGYLSTAIDDPAVSLVTNGVRDIKL